MTQKIIKIGSSAGVIVPKRMLEELGLRIGDQADVVIKPAKIKHKKFAEELDKFMDLYDQDLKNLANR